MAGSDERFQRLFDRLSKPQKTVRAEPLALTDRDGKVFAQLRNDSKVRRVEFSASVDNGFIEDVAKALTQQYNAFLSSRSQSKG
jgi:ParB family chromosome partitioning protein